MMRDLNVCKSGHCVNLGESCSPDYEYHIRPLGFLAMRCHRCSATPPMLDNQSYEQIWRYWQQKLAIYTGRCCPECGETSFKRFGNSAVQRPRLQCKSCSRTFSIRAPVMKAQLKRVAKLQQILSRLPDHEGMHDSRMEGLGIYDPAIARYAAKTGVYFDRASEQLYHFALASLWQCQPAKLVATAIFIAPYKGQDNALWCLVSTNMETGEILHISSTLIEIELPEEGRYQPCQDAPASDWDKNTSAMMMAEEQESRFLHRAQFDRCNFGFAQVAKKGVCHALPVLTAHAHFAVLNRLGHAIGQGDNVGGHCLQHEVFLRGACITQYAQYVKQHRMALLYVVGQTQSQCTPNGIRKLGWWQNSWQAVSDEAGNQKAFSVLCGVNRMQAEQISLTSSHSAIAYIQAHANYHQFGEFTPTRVNQLLAAIAMQFNQALWEAT